MPPLQHPGKEAPPALTYTDLIVRVDLARPELAGELIVDGQPTSTFTGWLGLLTALDDALDTLPALGPESAPSQARLP
jgi:hypothetical protein